MWLSKQLVSDPSGSVLRVHQELSMLTLIKKCKKWRFITSIVSYNAPLYNYGTNRDKKVYY